MMQPAKEQNCLSSLLEIISLPNLILMHQLRRRNGGSFGNNMQQLDLEKELEIWDATSPEGQRYLYSNIIERYNIAARSYYKALTMKQGFEPRIALKEGLRQYVKLEHQD